MLVAIVLAMVLSASGRAFADPTASQPPAEQARAIVENAIPYRVAATVVRQMTPTVLLALIAVRTCM